MLTLREPMSCALITRSSVGRTVTLINEGKPFGSGCSIFLSSIKTGTQLGRLRDAEASDRRQAKERGALCEGPPLVDHQGSGSHKGASNPDLHRTSAPALED